MQELISVIVPVYNIENYVDRCVESIVKQTYKNLEIILVDDGSSDRSACICDQWKERDTRIKVIHKRNGGLSDARNTGIKSATGNYYSFVDGDDMLDSQMIEKLYNALISANADVSMCRMEKIEQFKRYATREFLDNNISKIELDGVGAIRLLLREKIDCSACLKLYKKEMFSNLEFPYGKTNEDFVLMYKLFYKTQKIIYISDILYYYYFRENSITSSSFSEKQFDKIDNCIEMLEYIKFNLPEIKNEAYYYLQKQSLYLLKTLCITGLEKQYRNRYKQIRRILKENSIRIIKSNWFSLKEKMMIICITWFPGLYEMQSK